MKNKHNTMNSSSAKTTYIKMQDKLIEDPLAVCYLVEVIAKKSQDIIWEATLNGDHYKQERIRRISMDRFYGIVFGDNTAFMKLCKSLPLILDDVIEETEQSGQINNTVYSELKSISPETYKSLYLLAFRTYDGIDIL